MKINTDLSKILKPYSNTWVALNQEQTKVVGTGTTPNNALREAKKKNESDPVLLKAPQSWGSVVFYHGNK